MQVDQLWLTDFRSWAQVEITFAPGLTVLVGANGEGKTNLLEAVGYLASRSSFRGVPPPALVRAGCDLAVIRSRARRGGRDLLLEAELRPAGRDRYLLNRQPVRRARDLADGLRVSVFSPDDLVLVKGGPAERRRYLDTALGALHPADDALLNDLDRVLRQRNTLLKQLAPTRPERLDADAATTLDVWDTKLAAIGDAVADARRRLVDQLEPLITKAYQQLAGQPADISATYRASWAGTLADALREARVDELRRGVTLVGPHRDDLELAIDGLPARTHASQGEQRSLALALRLGAHHLAADVLEVPPVLLLDDVFSELDPDRSAALLAHLPHGQAILTTAGTIPPDARPERVLRLAAGRVAEAVAGTRP